MAADLKKIIEFIDANEAQYIAILSEAVAIKSVSATKQCRGEVIKMVNWFAEKLKAEKACIELVQLGQQKCVDGEMLPLPPILIGNIGSDPKKKTLLIYGHLDVQPAMKSDGWDTEPFVLTEKDGKLYGRGSTDDKGPVLCWLHAIGAFNKLGMQIPVNIKFCFEAMEESGSIGLDDFIESKRNTFFKSVDYVCISDSNWLGSKKPCITYGLRGLAYFFIEIECSSKDLHSGYYGGCVHEAMADLVALLASLLDEKGKILIPGIYNDVQPATKEEVESYKSIDFDTDAYASEIGCRRLLKDTKEDTLMARWRFPSLSIHGIEGAFSDQGTKTVIPKKVIGKFSVRVVPNQNPKKIEQIVINYLNDQFAKRNSPNSMKVYAIPGSGKPWITDIKNENIAAGRRAIKNVFGIEPDMTREGGSIPVTLTFHEILKKSIILLPIGAADDGAHSQNEKIDRKNYINGVKVFSSYLIELSK